MGTVSAEMSSWTALTWHIGMKTAFKIKNRKNKSFAWDLYYQDYNYYYYYNLLYYEDFGF